MKNTNAQDLARILQIHHLQNALYALVCLTALVAPCSAVVQPSTQATVNIKRLVEDSNGSVRADISGPAPKVYVLEVSSDLTNWSQIASNTLVSGSMTLEASNPPLRSVRFFRAVMTTDPPYEPGTVLLRFRPTLMKASVRQVSDAAALSYVASFSTKIMSDAGQDPILIMKTLLPVPEAVRRLEGHPAIEFVQPNFIYTITVTPNDPKFADGSLWGLSSGNTYASHAANAWADGYTGSTEVVVGIVDTGIDINHADLAANIWVNSREIAGNSRDDDANGFVDDINGWDFYRNDASVFDSDEHYHGTHVAGTIGAVGNNAVGVVGVNWRVKMVVAKVADPEGHILTSTAVSAFDYLTGLKKSGVNLVAINNSWGGGGYDNALHSAIIRAAKQSILIIAGAGNFGIDNDAYPFYPASYDTRQGTVSESPADYDAVVAVAAIDSIGTLASFSDYGAQSVDIGAPGVGIYSTLPRNSYGFLDGTSMACPHVTGAAALYASTHPQASALEIRSALLGSAAYTPSLAGKTKTNGRLNLSTVIRPNGDPVAAPSSLEARGSVDALVALTWIDNANNEQGFRLERSIDGVNFNLLGNLPSNSVQFIDTGTQPGVTYWYRVRAFSQSRSSDWSNVRSVTVPGGPGSVIYVDRSYQGTVEDGTAAHPFKTIKNGYGAASSGARLIVQTGIYNAGILSFLKAVRFEAPTGLVTIQP